MSVFVRFNITNDKDVEYFCGQTLQIQIIWLKVTEQMFFLCG